MSRPAKKDCHAYVENTRMGGREENIRAARLGKAPLVHIWVHEVGNGGRGIILDVEQATDLVEGLNDLLDEIEDDEG